LFNEVQMMQKSEAIIIGAGISGLSSACYLSKYGFEVTLVEKNESIGGRARQFKADGFTFDMGPSWYWMPEVFDNFFADFSCQTNQFYELKRLDPSYRVYFPNEYKDIPADLDAFLALVESMETGAAEKMKWFLEEAAYKYRVGMDKMVWKPGLSFSELLDKELISGVVKLDVFKSMTTHIKSLFKNPQLIQLLEFPVLFLGDMPKRTPALYSLMNYADIKLGTWYPEKGMFEIIKAMRDVALSLGVKIIAGAEVSNFIIEDKQIKGVLTSKGKFQADVVIASADYHHVEQQLLPKEYRMYDEAYWDKRKMAPSSLIFYLGINKKIKNLLHHNLFFDESFDAHAEEIYEKPNWPQKPLFYASVTSKTDLASAPEGCENLFILIPVAPNLKSNERLREKYYEQVMNRLEERTGESIKASVIFKRSFAHEEFIADYHSFKGNAYGLANTLMQTSILKPSIKNKKLSNLYYAGQLTVPGPGVPPSIISGKVVATLIAKEIKTTKTTPIVHESTI
jgi:phytoene desaturase